MSLLSLCSLIIFVPCPISNIVAFLVVKEQAVVKYLLQKFPELAFMPNASGRLPIEVALTAGRTWHSGIRELVQANPNSLSQVDQILGLYPFQLAAQVVGDASGDESREPLRKKRFRKCKTVQATTDTTVPSKSNPAGEEGSLHKLDTIFNLLRQCPSLVKFAQK